MRLRPCVAVTGLAILFFAAVSGCSPENPVPPLGEVTGVVTLDGKPLAGAVVSFIPGKGRISTGQTDAAGKYELRFSADDKGAVVGPHTVRITTRSEDPAKMSPEKLPAKYNSATTLTAEVKAEKNVIPFDLTSK